MANKDLTKIVLDEVSMCSQGTNKGAHIMLMKAVTKKEQGENFPPAAFAYVPDIEKSDTWKVRLWETLDKKETSEQVAKAILALGKDATSIPEETASVKKKVLTAWAQLNNSRIVKAEYGGVTFDEILLNSEILDQLWNSVYILEDSLYSIMYNDKIVDMADKLALTTSQFQSQLLQIAKGDNMPGLEKLQKETEVLQKKFEDLEKTFKTLQAEKEALEKENKVLKDAKGAVTETDIDKDTLPANVKKHLDDIEKKNEAIEKKNEDNAKLIAKMLLDKENDVFITKAGTFNNIALDTKEFGPVLNKIDKALTSEEMALVIKTLTSANELIGKGNVFKETGSNNPETGGSALSKMDAEASELMKADTSLTKEKAHMKVMETNPALYNQYLEEKAV